MLDVLTLVGVESYVPGTELCGVGVAAVTTHTVYERELEGRGDDRGNGEAL